MSSENSIVNLGDISKPATVLIERISDAVGGIFKPYQMRRVAQAEADAKKIQAAGEIKVTELQRRAMYRFLQEEAKRQENIESITAKALPELSADAKPEQVTNDWITDFFDKCRLISDLDMQQLWAKVLAGEANKPGKYSKRTLSLLSSLDKSDAELFTKLCSFAWSIEKVGSIVPLVYDYRNEVYSKGEISCLDLIHLSDIGLIRFEGLAGGFRRLGIDKKSLVCYYGKQVKALIHFPKPKGNALHWGQVSFSKAGEQLASICSPKPQEGFVDYVFGEWRKQGLTVEVVST